MQSVQVMKTLKLAKQGYILFQDYNNMRLKSIKNCIKIQDSAYLWGTGEMNMVVLGCPGNFVFTVLFLKLGGG